MALRRLRSLWNALVRRSELEQRITDELSFHVEARADDLMARHGLSRPDAVRRARIEFGSMAKFKEQGRASYGIRLIDELRADFRYALRTLARNRGFAAAAVATLGLGIGANAAVFSVADAVLLRELPVRSPDELVGFQWLRTADAMVASYSGYGRPASQPGVGIRTSFSLLTLERFQDRSQSLTNIFAIARLSRLTVVADGVTETAAGQAVTGDYFPGLGVAAHVGRTLGPEDDRVDVEPVAVISHRFWQRRFNGDSAVVGRLMTVNRVAITIVGVTAEGFHGTRATESVDVSVPMAHAQAITGRTYPLSAWWVEMMGRLRAGVTREQASAELQAMFRDTVLESWAARPANTPNPERSTVPELRVVPGGRGADAPRLDALGLLAILFAVVAAVLFVACVNLANLLLVRASTRGQEVAVRLALGASRGRLVRQMLTEGGVLAVGGAIAGVLVATCGKDFFSWLPAGGETPVIDSSIDGRVLAFTALLSILTAFAFSIAPALRVTGRHLSQSMRVGPNQSMSRNVARKALIAIQVAVCLVLLVGSGLLLRTLRNFSAVNVGFNADNLLVFRVNGRDHQTFEDLVTEFEALPGVTSATVSAVPLVARSEWSAEVSADGAAQPREGFIQNVRWNFFDTMGMPILIGRSLQPGDTKGAPMVAVINETMARQLFGEQSPLGRPFWLDPPAGRTNPIEVVGVVADAKYARLDEPAPPTFYRPYLQLAVAPMTFEVRTAPDPAALVPVVREAARRVDSNLALIDIKTQRDQIAQTIDTERSVALITTIFGFVGLLLASIGLYGVVWYDATRRTNEIGIRMALGARPADVINLVARETFVTVGIGVAAGLALTLATGRVLARFLFGVAPTDPLTMAGSALVFAAVAVLAAYVPVRRALRQDPTQALRYE